MKPQLKLDPWFALWIVVGLLSAGTICQILVRAIEVLVK